MILIPEVKLFLLIILAPILRELLGGELDHRQKIIPLKYS